MLAVSPLFVAIFIFAVLLVAVGWALFWAHRRLSADPTLAWSTRFQDGDRVEWIGPEDPNDWELPRRGERGWVLSIDPPNEWAVSWDRAGTAVYGERYLRRVDDEPRRPPLAQYYRPAVGGPVV